MSLPALPLFTQARLPTLARSEARCNRRRPAIFAVFLVGFCQAAVPADLPLKDQPHLRRPVASAWIESGKAAGSGESLRERLDR